MVECCGWRKLDRVRSAKQGLRKPTLGVVARHEMT